MEATSTSDRCCEDNVPAEVKQRRLDELMILQQDISSEVEADKVGKTTTVSSTATNGLYYFYAKDKAGNTSSTYYLYLDTSKPTGTMKSIFFISTRARRSFTLTLSRLPPS